MLSCSEFDFKWSVHAIDAYIYVKSSTLSTLQFLTVSHLKPVIYIASYIMALRIANTNHATTDMAMCILK